MQLGDRNELSAQIRDCDTCFAEFLKPSGNGQKILQAILLREAFSLLAQRGIAIRQDAPTVILDVSCGPGDYSVAWTSQIARFLPRDIALLHGLSRWHFQRNGGNLCGDDRKENASGGREWK
jgi:hypothetical protein